MPETSFFRRVFLPFNELVPRAHREHARWTSWFVSASAAELNRRARARNNIFTGNWRNLGY